MTTNVQKAAAIFGVAEDLIKQQFAKNAKQLRDMAARARLNGGQYRGKTAQEWTVLADQAEASSK